MFEKPFDQLFRALERIEEQLGDADSEQKAILREELLALRSLCDRFVQKWVIFEEKLTEMSEEFSLDLDGPKAVSASAYDASGYNPVQLSVKQKPLTKHKLFSWAGIPDVHHVTEQRIIRSFRKGMGFFELFMYPDAIRELEQVLQLDGTFAVARLYLALGFLGNREYEKAQLHLDLVASVTTEPFLMAIVHITFGHIRAAQLKYEEALDDFAQAAAFSDSFRDVYFNMGVCQYNLRMYEEALASFMAALEQEPDDWEAELIVSYIWKRLHSADKAVEHIKRAYALNSSSAEVLMQFADLCQEVGQFHTAETIYRRMCRFYPNHPGPWSGLGWLQLRRGKYEQAVNHFKRQICLEPNSLQAQFNFAWAMLESGEHHKAEQIFSETLAHNQDFMPARIGLASVLLDRGEYQAAMGWINKALKQQPDSKDLWFYKGMAHTGLGQNDEAELCWNHCQ